MNKLSVGEKIGKYLRYQREKRGISINELAKSMELTPSFLMRLEKGSYSNVKFDVIEKIAYGFQMTVEDFLEKCEIISRAEGLPPIEFYLRETYQLPKKAIDDVIPL